MPQITSTQHPAHAKIWDHVQPSDFIDGYAIENGLSPKAAMKIAFDMPAWVDALMSLRNKVMKPFGLKTEGIASDRTVLFPITYEDDGQILIGTDDRHLNFRISILSHDGKIHMATWVHRNNTLGRVYLAIVMPFHILIVRNCLGRVATASIASPRHSS